MDNIIKAAEIIAKSKGIAFTGAGISTPSNIPDFRSPSGIWAKYNVREYAYIDRFIENPEKVWEFFKLRIKEFSKALPNNAHMAFAELESIGFLEAVITQNIDGLHQKGGSKNVLELHGTITKLVCLNCQKKYESKDFDFEQIKLPLCKCGKILKPDVVFFGEPLPEGVFNRAVSLALSSSFVIVAGTSGVVYPAAQIPYIAKRNGATIIEINKEKTEITRTITDIFIQGSVDISIPEIVENVKKIIGK
ncbi:MAG TPA: NAD-dependent deacylase [Spirochaetota bacterium]|nr:NAD-dependent deacylase [Spirochaetota bacterium]HOM37533.1 NAD-dependent deacylase [Spirochaetota bacterium]HPQ49495.1 NAD-dependent deacylase [Spirochaetota bacterium]